jgi:YxiJ-like protein
MGRTTSLIAGGDFEAVAKNIQQRYATELLRPFPYKDCYKLRKLQPLAHDLIPDLDLYFSFVAGYSASATQLKNRPTEELRAAIPKLQKSFFDTMPRYRKLQKYITPKDTPNLHEELRVINDVRQSLVILMSRLI